MAPRELYSVDSWGDPWGYRAVVEDYSGLGPLAPWQRRGRPRMYWPPRMSIVHQPAPVMRSNAAVLGSAQWARVRKAMKNRAGWRCQRCGRPGRLEVHHKTPLERGGAPFDPDNLECLCRTCHIAHHRARNLNRNRREPTEAERRWTKLVDDMRAAP